MPVQKFLKKRNKMKVILIFCLVGLSACTYSINMVHTEGRAEDVVDETQSNRPNISPNFTIPFKGF